MVKITLAYNQELERAWKEWDSEREDPLEDFSKFCKLKYQTTCHFLESTREGKVIFEFKFKDAEKAILFKLRFS